MKDLNLLTLAAITLVILSVGTLVGMAVLTKTGDVMRTNTIITNESFTAVNNTAVSLANTYVRSASTITIYNDTARSTTVGSSLYAINYDTGAIVNLDYANTKGLDWLVDYTYGASNTVVTTATVFIAGLLLFATFSTLVALVIIGKIVIKLVKEK